MALNLLLLSYSRFQFHRRRDVLGLNLPPKESSFLHVSAEKEILPLRADKFSTGSRTKSLI